MSTLRIDLVNDVVDLEAGLIRSIEVRSFTNPNRTHIMNIGLLHDGTLTVQCLCPSARFGRTRGGGECKHAKVMRQIVDAQAVAA